MATSTKSRPKAAKKKDTKVEEVVQLLAKLQQMGEEAQKVTAHTKAALQPELIKAVEPDPSLLYPWEPNFNPNYKIEVSGGVDVSLDNVWEALVAGENILFVGPTGCGKSAAAFHLIDRACAAVRNKNLVRHGRNALKLQANPNVAEKELEGYLPMPYPVAHYSCHGGSRSEDLVGTVDLIYDEKGNKKPIVRHGAVVDAWVNGKILILEESDMIQPDIAAEMHQFLDGRTKETMLYINGPQHIVKHERFRVLATQNTLGRGENQIEFAGTQIQNTALLNRFTYVVKLSWLPEAEEIKVLTKKTEIDTATAKSMVEAATKAREAYDAETVDTVISTRDLLSWSRECKRQEKRLNVTVTDLNYWRKVVIPSAHPCFLARIVDESTRSAFNTYLSLF